MAALRDGAEILLDVNTTAAAYAASMRGITSTALSAAPTASGRVVALGDGYRGLTLRIFGVGADLTNGTFKLWRRRRVTPSAPGGTRELRGTTPAIDRVLVGTGTFILSSACAVPTSTNNMPFPTGNVFADVMTFVVDTEFQALIDTLGGGGTVAKCYSPGDDGTSGIAMLAISDLFDAEGFEVELLKGTATSVNGVVDLTR